MCRQILFILLLVQLVASGVAMAQTNVEVNAGLQLNLSQPGARSLGMGGAFIGLADDATAAYTNPAGLANLSSTEIAAEGRAWDFTTSFTDRGLGTFAGDGLDDTELIEGTTESSTEGYSFGSFAMPRGRWVWALYRHQLAKFETSIVTQGAIGATDDFLYFLRPVEGSTSLEIVGTGVAGAVRLSDSFSLGFAVINYKLTWNSRTRRFEDPSFLSTELWTNQQDITGDDEAVSASVGFGWKIAEHWHLGGVYRRGAEFDFKTSNTGGPGAGSSNGEIFDRDAGTFRVPNVYGLGVAFTSASFRVLADWVRVEYSALTESTVEAFTNEASLTQAASRLTLDDADEIHLGIEYVFAQMRNPLALRLGAWLDPDHEIRYEGPITTGDDVALALLFRGGDEEIHTTAGLGIAFADGRFEVNAAVDLSERLDTASLSVVWRFF